MWLVIKHKETGELSMVDRWTRERQVQLWACNAMIVPSIVLRQFNSPEAATDFLIELQRISELINNILEKDEEKFGSDSNL